MPLIPLVRCSKTPVRRLTVQISVAPAWERTKAIAPESHDQDGYNSSPCVQLALAIAGLWLLPSGFINQMRYLVPTASILPSLLVSTPLETKAMVRLSGDQARLS